MNEVDLKIHDLLEFLEKSLIDLDKQIAHYYLRVGEKPQVVILPDSNSQILSERKKLA